MNDTLTPTERAQSYREAAAMARQNAKTHQAMAKAFPAEADHYSRNAIDALDRRDHYLRLAMSMDEIAAGEHEHAA